MDYITLPAMRYTSLLAKTMRWVGVVNETNKILWDSWAWKPFYVYHFLLVGRMFQPARPLLSSKGQMLGTAANQGREMMKRQLEEQPRKNSAALR